MSAARPARRLVLPPADGAFVAIDFETADYGADSACAVGLVRVENLRVVAKETVLIRPPRQRIVFTRIHGITWPMVREAPLFGDIWPRLAPMLDGAHALVAHNAPFDRGVLHTCCVVAGHPIPVQPFLCTVQVARRRWNRKPNNLPSVCARLGIDLRHHDAGSDAEACARILIAAYAADSVPEVSNPASPPPPGATPADNNPG